MAEAPVSTTPPRWIPNLSRIELDITVDCSLRCYNCHRSVRQAPSTEGMTVEQVSRFVDESIALDWPWSKVKLLGGEPTLHPQLFEILGELRRLQERRPSVRLDVVTNGFSPKTKEVLDRLPSWVEISNSAKTGNVQTFSSFNVAPIDVEGFRDQDFSRGCWVTHYCGIGLNRTGYYPCGQAGGIDRIFGFDIGIKRLADVTVERLQAILQKTCAVCGCFKDCQAPHDNSQWISEERISETWQNAYRLYQLRRPTLTTY